MSACEIVEQQFVYLSRLQEIQGVRPVLVQRPQGGDLNIEGKFWVDWHNVWTSLPLITCSVLTNEIAFDPDLRDWSGLKKEMDRLVEFLNTQKIPYLLSWSGGKGVHLEIYFSKDIEIPEDIVEGVKKYQLDVGRTIRIFLATWILEHAKVSAEAIQLDWGKIKWSGTSNGSMIRIFGCQRPNGGVKTLIDSIPDEQPLPGKLALRFPDYLKTWSIAFLKDEILKTIREEIEQSTPEEPMPFVKWMEEQIEKAKAEGRIHEPKGGKGKKCQGLQQAFKGRIPEGHRDEVATGIAIAMRFWKKESKEKTMATISKWCSTCTPPLDFRGRSIDRKIQNIYLKQNTEHPPCTFFIKAGLCEGANCKIINKSHKNQLRRNKP